MEVNGERLEITARQTLAIDFVAQGLPLVRVAAATGIARRTLQLWMQQPSFRQALERRQAERRSQIDAELKALTLVAIATLRDFLTNDEASACVVHTKVQTALALLAKLGITGGSKP